jgi:hypothetical protein
MTNPFEDALVYLVSDENQESENTDFPTLDKRMVGRGQEIEICSLSDGKPFEVCIDWQFDEPWWQFPGSGGQVAPTLRAAAKPSG